MNVEVEPRSDYLYVHMSGKYVEDIPIEGHPASMARACLEGNYRCLLVDVREVTGFIGTLEYFHQGEQIAGAFMVSDCRIAVVGTAERKEMLMFFEDVVTNRRIKLKVFIDIDEAEEWLMA